jgi:hypothetical protein
MGRNGPLTRPEKDMPRLILVLQLLLFAMAGLAQESAPDRTVSSTPEQLRLGVLLDRLSSLPPEYKADLGFTILDSAATRDGEGVSRRRWVRTGDIPDTATRVMAGKT